MTKQELWSKAAKEAKTIPFFVTRSEKSRHIVILCELLKSAMKANEQ